MAKRSLEEIKKLNYRQELRFDKEEGRWFITFPELPGCEADGETEEEALKRGREVKDLWLEMARETHREIPEPEPEPTFSGRLLVRLPKALHEKAAKYASREGVSLNALVMQMVAQGVERLSMQRVFGMFNAHLRKAMRDAVQESGPGLYAVWMGLAMKKIDQDVAVIPEDTKPVPPPKKNAELSDAHSG